MPFSKRDADPPAHNTYQKACHAKRRTGANLPAITGSRIHVEGDSGSDSKGAGDKFASSH